MVPSSRKVSNPHIMAKEPMSHNISIIPPEPVFLRIYDELENIPDPIISPTNLSRIIIY
jgi:hypothetical protein